MNRGLFLINERARNAVAATLVFCVIASSFFAFAAPREARAQAFGFSPDDVGSVAVAAVSVPVNDTVNNLKEGFWDGVAWGIAKIALNRLTLSIVDWIRTGYDGQPSFLTNPESFLRDIGNQATGVFINELGLNDILCGPWQFSVRLALQVQAPYLIKARCTLVDAEANFQRMSENFMEAGWQGFFDITVNQTNNPYNAFLSAQSELAVRIGEKEENQKNDLLAGRGFLGVTKKGECLQEVPTGFGGMQCVRRAPDTTVTPGSYVADMMSGLGMSPVRQMELADELDEALSVIAGEIILQALNPNRGLSNIDTITLEQANEALAQQTAARLGENGGAVDIAINDVTEARNIKNASLAIIAGPIDNAYTGLIGVEDVASLPGTAAGQLNTVLTNGSCIARSPVTESTPSEVYAHIAVLGEINATEAAIISDISEAGTLLSTLNGWKTELGGTPTAERLEQITSGLNNLPSRLTENAASNEKSDLEGKQSAVETALSACETALVPAP